VTYDPDAHRQAERAQYLRLVAAGPGWHAYALAKARRLVKEDPTLHGDLVEAVTSAINQETADAL
jgi:hypothetical protein